MSADNYDLQLSLVMSQRQKEYVRMTDHLKLEADYDSLKNNTPLDYSKWLAAVDEVKKRFPKPLENPIEPITRYVLFNDRVYEVTGALTAGVLYDAPELPIDDPRVVQFLAQPRKEPTVQD